MRVYQSLVEWVLLGVLVRSCLHQAAPNPAPPNQPILPAIGWTYWGKVATGGVVPLPGRDNALDEGSEEALFI